MTEEQKKQGRIPKRGVIRGLLAFGMVFLIVLAIAMAIPSVATTAWWWWIIGVVAGVLAYQGRI